MRILYRAGFLTAVLAWLTFACGPLPISTPSANPPTSGSAPQAPGETPALTAMPAQKDLLFIEFFAGT
jgi:hypothetical protein